MAAERGGYWWGVLVVLLQNSNSRWRLCQICREQGGVKRPRDKKRILTGKCVDWDLTGMQVGEKHLASAGERKEDSDDSRKSGGEKKVASTLGIRCMVTGWKPTYSQSPLQACFTHPHIPLQVQPTNINCTLLQSNSHTFLFKTS